MKQKTKYEEWRTNERYMKLFPNQFVFAEAAMKEAVDLIKSGKAESEGITNVAVYVLQDIEKDKIQAS